ncbi:MAG: hypothetical protein IAE97_00490 [Chthoniobacterales bacterium]|nr:hypothetical protein [Chthoniobacterales bacterium]
MRFRHDPPNVHASISRSVPEALRRVAGLIGALVLGACAPGGRPPDALLRQAWEDYRNSEFALATQTFRALQASQPAGAEIAVEALYGEASCWNHRRSGRNIAKAVALYDALLDQHPDSPLAPWAALDRVRTRHLAPADQDIDFPQLIQDYAALERRYPGTPAAADAFLYRIRLAVSLADAAQAAVLATEIEAHLAAHPEEPYRSPLLKILAEAHHKRGAEDRRLASLVGALESREDDPSTPFFERSTAYWEIAYAAEFDAGDFALARKFHRLLLEEFPNDDRAFAAEKALARMDRVEADVRAGRMPPADRIAPSPQ